MPIDIGQLPGIMPGDLQRLRLRNIMDGSGSIEEGGQDMGGFSPDQDPYAAETGTWQQSSDLPNAILGPDGMPLYQAPSPSPTPNAPVAPTVQNPYGDPSQSVKRTMDLVNQVYTPETQSRDRYNNLLDNFPKREAPGWGRALIAAGLSGRSADPIKTANEVLYAPHLRDVADFNARAEPFGKAAQFENTANANERALAGNVVNAQTQADRLAETARNNDMKNEQATVRNRAYAYTQSLGKGYDWDLTGPTAKKFNKTTGDVVDTGIPTGKMDEQTKIDLQNEGKIAAARASGEAAVDRIRAGGGQVYDTPQGPYRYNPNDPTTPAARVPGLPQGSSKIGTDRPATPPNATERAKTEQERIRDVMEQDPGARKLLTPRGNGVYGMSPRPVPHEDTWYPGDHVPQEAADEWDRVKKLIDPSYVPPPPTIPRVGAGGIGPSTPPGTSNKVPSTTNITTPSKDINGPQKTTGQDYRLKQNPNNPNEKVRSFDGGRTWQKSTDGGKTWR